MFTSTATYSERIECNHERFCEDVHEGSTTCLDCSRVIDEQLFYMADVFKESEKYESQFEILRDLQDLWQLPLKIISQTRHKYKKLHSNRKLVSFKKKEILAFALYVTLMQNECSRTPDEIVCIFGLTKKNILFQIGIKANEVNLPNIDDFIQRFATIFQFTFREKSDLLRINSEFVFRASIQPTTKAVILLFCYCEMKKKKISLKEIAEKCFVSFMNITRLLKVYPEIRKEFTLVYQNVFKKNDLLVGGKREI